MENMKAELSDDQNDAADRDILSTSIDLLSTLVEGAGGNWNQLLQDKDFTPLLP